MDIWEKLTKWSTDRSLDKMEYNRNGFCTNIAEERYELLLGVQDDDANEIVDAICDIIVFSNTELSKFGTMYSSCDMENIIGAMEHEYGVCIAYDLYLTSVIGKLIDTDDEEEQIVLLLDIISLSLEALSYIAHPALCLEECHKEINSRTGAWSDEHKKWKKFTTEEAKSLWYKADYTNYLKVDDE
jgi:hypothetical protein